MANPILNLGNNEWATKSESLLGYSKSGSNFKPVPFTHSRASIGTTIDRNGVLQTEAGNIPRIDFKDNIKGTLLLEPQRTNYALNSNDASQWNNVGGSQSITKTQNYSIAPDGTQTAARLQASVTGSQYALISRSTSSITGSYSASVYVKSNTGSSQNISFYGRNSSTSAISVGTEWQRIEFQGSGTSGQNLYFNVGTHAGLGGDDNIDILVWGGQIEQGTYPTSYIPTEGSTVTRLVDRCTGGGDDDLFNDSEGTLFLDIYDFKSSVNPEITLSSGSATNRITLVYYASSNQLRFFISSNNVVQADQFVSYTYSQRNKIALRYKQNDFKAYINGTQVFSDTSGNTPIGLSRFDFSKYDQSNGFVEGKINQAMVFNEALSDSELQTLTTL